MGLSLFSFGWDTLQIPSSCPISNIKTVCQDLATRIASKLRLESNSRSRSRKALEGQQQKRKAKRAGGLCGLQPAGQMQHAMFFARPACAIHVFKPSPSELGLGGSMFWHWAKTQPSQVCKGKQSVKRLETNGLAMQAALCMFSAHSVQTVTVVIEEHASSISSTRGGKQ